MGAVPGPGANAWSEGVTDIQWLTLPKPDENNIFVLYNIDTWKVESTVTYNSKLSGYV